MMHIRIRLKVVISWPAVICRVLQNRWKRCAISFAGVWHRMMTNGSLYSGWICRCSVSTVSDKSMLDEIAPDRLFWIEAADGHSITVNQRVLDLAGITSETPDPPEGVIERRDGSNEPNGTLRESAQEIVAALRPERHLDESIVTMRVAIEATNAVGVTFAHRRLGGRA